MNQDEMRLRSQELESAVAAMQETLLRLQGEIGYAAYSDIVTRWNALIAAHGAVMLVFMSGIAEIAELAT